jgi:hypothetical protein
MSKSMPSPSTSATAPPFAEDTINDSYDADAVTRFWHILTRTEHALAKLASRFNGKASPIQLFWDSFDHGGREPTSQTSIACWCSPAQR